MKMEKNEIYIVVITILLLSFANFYSISAIKNTKLDTIELDPNSNFKFPQFIEVTG